MNRANLTPVVEHFSTEYLIAVTHDTNEDGEGVWCAESEALGLVTEAPTYEALVARAHAVVPDIAAANQLSLQGARLRFEHLVAA